MSDPAKASEAAQVDIRKTTDADLSDSLEWLRQEQDATGDSFYHNRTTIEAAHEQGHAFVARVKNRCVGLLVDCGRGPEIVATHPAYRRQGIGRALLLYSAAQARRRGEKEIRARCVTDEGVRLCRAVGFLPGGKWTWRNMFALQIT